MMLTENPWLPPAFHRPQRSSPLSSRDTNTCPRHYTASMMDANRNVAFSKRQIKSNPMLQSRDARVQQRRNLFLKKVKDDRDSRNYESRMDELLRLEHISTKKRWEQELAQQQPDIEFWEDSEGTELPMSTRQKHHQALFSSSQNEYDAEVEAEMIRQEEERELQALIMSMEEDDRVNRQESTLSHFGSDDDIYDDIIVECIKAEDFMDTDFD